MKIIIIGLILGIVVLLLIYYFITTQYKKINDTQVIKDIFCKFDKLKLNPTKDTEYLALKKEYENNYNITLKNCRIKKLNLVGVK